MTPRLAMVFRAMLWVMTGIVPRQWVAVHRKHHAYTDVAGDPHSPLLSGFWKIQLGNVFYYRKVATDIAVVNRYARDLPADKWDKRLFDRPLIGLGLGIALLVLIFGWKVGLIAAAIHTVTYLLLNGAVNAVGHVFGSRPQDNTATNNQWLAWLTGGEGLHNNHHAAPTSARLAFVKGQIDPGWWCIRFFAKRGWATVRHSEIRMRKTSSGMAA